MTKGRARRSLIVVLFLSCTGGALARERALTFDERVRAQEAIERVLDRHRIWPEQNPLSRPPFERRVSRTALEARVDDYLRQSTALARIWHRPVTAEQLALELERMVSATRDPGVLQELFDALGRDPEVVAECLARPLLADRLIHAWYDGDTGAADGASFGAWWAARRATFPRASGTNGSFVLRTARGSSGAGCDAWQGPPGLVAVPSRAQHTAIWTGAEMIVWGGSNPSGHRYTPATDSWVRMADPPPGAASGFSDHTAVWSGTEMIVWGGWNFTVQRTGGRYSPATDSWVATSTAGACPDGTADHTAVWTGSEMLVWGGQSDVGLLASGARYSPSTDTWRSTSTGAGCPLARWEHTAVWTGSEMIVWGGIGGGQELATGARYAPASDSWQTLATAGAPDGRAYHSAVWTGSEMIVWGGVGRIAPHELDSGGRYSPSTNSWMPTTTIGAPAARALHKAVWTGTEMIIWGGSLWSPSTPLDSGGRYRPDTDTWTAVASAATPSARFFHSVVWTGSEMIVWGGRDDLVRLNSGGRYAPATDGWVATSQGNGPQPRGGHTAIWTGSEMIVWGGAFFNTGGRYFPALDAWLATPTSGDCPVARYQHTAVWNGTEMIVWGGSDPNANFDSGGRYDPLADAWTATSRLGCPSIRRLHTAVWTGAEMIVWGGSQGTGIPLFDDGGRYDPVADSWVPTATGGSCPAPREAHTAVWTGTEMIVWGGADLAGPTNTGGRYEPSTDSWMATSTGSGCPAAGARTAVWTGTEMILWGGLAGNEGGRYAPSSDAWTPTSTTGGCPSARGGATTVWTGSEMVVWGGHDVAAYVDSGGRYDPATDSWAATSTGQWTPVGRTDHTAVWTGREMIVWGGTSDSDRVASGSSLIVDACVDFVAGTGLGPPNPNRIRVATGDGVMTSVDVVAYGAGAWGATAASGDVNLGTHAEILAAPGPGPTLGPQIRAFDAIGAPLPKVNFYAYGTLKYGANVTAGNLDTDGFDEMGTGAGPGEVFGPHVRGWGFDGASMQPLGKVNYYAYGTLKWGVNLAYGDLDADLLAEIVTAPGPGIVFSPQVRGWNHDGAPVTSIAKINFNAFSVPEYGANVAAGDVDGDAHAEMAAAQGPGPDAAFPARFLGFDYDGVAVAALPGFDVTPFGTMYGGRVGLGDVSLDGRADLLVGAGRDPLADARVESLSYIGGALTMLPGSFVPFSTMYGVNVASGTLGH